MPETWGDLPKSQIDPATVDEEIDTKIQTHLDDPDAHIETGQSLQSHKSADIIDHLAKSIVEDKLADLSVSPRAFVTDKLLIWPSFESLDAWNSYGDGAASLTFGCITIDTAQLINSNFNFYADFGTPGVHLLTKNPVFDCTFQTFVNTSQKIYVFIGSFDYDVAGWKIEDDKLYAMVYVNGVEHLHEITGVDFTVFHRYRVKIVNASDVQFFVDDVLVHEETNYTLTDDYQDFLFNIDITTKVASLREIQFIDLKYFEDL